MRIIGLDIHRVFAEAVALEDGDIKRLGRIGMTRAHLEAFAGTLDASDHVVVEATSNATAVTEILSPHVARVVVANPLQVHLIAKAKIKTDAIDAKVLAKLYAAGFLPEVWIPDAATLARRRQVTRRTQLVRQRVRLKSMIQSILHANLIPRCPHVDLLGGKGRAWVRAQYLPKDEQDAVEQHIQEYDRLTEAQAGVERDIAKAALADANVIRLMTIPGMDMVVAVGLMAAIGQIERFNKPDRLAAYVGLNPSVHQSGDGPAYHGRIAKRGRSNARHLLVEAAWQTVRSPGPLRAFYERVRARRGNHIAAVAVARKLTVIIWHLLTKGEDYDWVRPDSTPRRYEISNCVRAARSGAVNEVDPTTTIYLIAVARNVLARSRRSLPTGERHKVGEGKDRSDPRTPHLRSDNDQAARQGSILSPALYHVVARGP